MRTLGWISMTAALLLVFAGCQHAPGVAIAPAIEPKGEDAIVVDDVVVLLDASGSMHFKDKFEHAKELAGSFVNAAPAGQYNMGLVAYGGEWEMDWHAADPQAFDREAMLARVEETEWLAGSTRLEKALDFYSRYYATQKGRTALVVFSDGKTDPNPVLEICDELELLHQGPLCIHTVQLGSNDDGQMLLEQMATIAGCGSYRLAENINSEAGMQDFARAVFLGHRDMLDDDNDGVPNHRDRCPNTPKEASVNKRGCWELKGLRFDTDSAAIKPRFGAILDSAARVLKANPGLEIRVDGHTDSRGSAAYNQGLSQRRAEAVRQALVRRGVDAARLAVKGFGEAQPVAPNTNAKNMSKNRRVELSVLN